MFVPQRHGHWICKADLPRFHVSGLLTPALTRPRWQSILADQTAGSRIALQKKTLFLDGSQAVWSETDCMSPQSRTAFAEESASGADGDKHEVPCASFCATTAQTAAYLSKIAAWA
ncbi:hypothetical protein JMJ77_0002497 [Colletotrichum scovillei]|uniref:Uncharacterized protein n=1 Tax=Colletotrichum scovillei TaxID=1209932 RepID=A0A9P7R831_9PEZI|nr:hypothetical protein JMJ77_0002497 [Colletotrichum scovillei]KAG7070917.1 hypothetical protein JMJ76_0002160 [Colletotrichum scovillei]KAG7079163.1 hypothetical protein JMJ78_0002822 [Colletotrichum scovillei]